MLHWIIHRLVQAFKLGGLVHVAQMTLAKVNGSQTKTHESGKEEDIEEELHGGKGKIEREKRETEREKRDRQTERVGQAGQDSER